MTRLDAYNVITDAIFEYRNKNGLDDDTELHDKFEEMYKKASICTREYFVDDTLQLIDQLTKVEEALKFQVEKTSLQPLLGAKFSMNYKAALQSLRRVNVAMFNMIDEAVIDVS